MNTTVLSGLSRQRVHSYLEDAVWPLSPVLVANAARHHGAPSEVLDSIVRVRNRQYRSEEDFWTEYSKLS